MSHPELFIIGALRALVEVAMLFLLGQGPVSYTHLRAHETVLDLVCRLLRLSLIHI